MTWKRVLARAISEVSGMARGIAKWRPGFRILLYHSIGSYLAGDSYGISITRQRFERHMSVLTESQTVSVVDLHEGQSSTVPRRIALTFDDGYRDILEVAAPILMAHKIPFTVFVTSSYVQSNSALYLTPTELRRLADLSGVTIGSHGATHIPMAECADGVLWKEVHGSRLYLEDVLGKSVTAISYPHGAVNMRVRDAAQRAGYTLGVCSRADINEDDRDPLLLCRTEIVSGDSERVFRQKLGGAWDWYRWRAADPASLSDSPVVF